MFSKQQDRGWECLYNFVASNHVAVIVNEGKFYVSVYAVKTSTVCYQK